MCHKRISSFYNNIVYFGSYNWQSSTLKTFVQNLQKKHSVLLFKYQSPGTNFRWPFGRKQSLYLQLQNSVTLQGVEVTF